MNFHFYINGSGIVHLPSGFRIIIQSMKSELYFVLFFAQYTVHYTRSFCSIRNRSNCPSGIGKFERNEWREKSKSKVVTSHSVMHEKFNIQQFSFAISNRIGDVAAPLDSGFRISYFWISKARRPLVNAICLAWFPYSLFFICFISSSTNDCNVIELENFLSVFFGQRRESKWQMYDVRSCDIAVKYVFCNSFHFISFHFQGY